MPRLLRQAVPDRLRCRARWHGAARIAGGPPDLRSRARLRVIASQHLIALLQSPPLGSRASIAGFPSRRSPEIRQAPPAAGTVRRIPNCRAGRCACPLPFTMVPRTQPAPVSPGNMPVFDVPLSVLLFAFAAFLLAGFVKGFIGMGLPTIATGLLTTVMAPGQAAALLVIPNLTTNIWQAFSGKHL